NAAAGPPADVEHPRLSHRLHRGDEAVHDRGRRVQREPFLHKLRQNGFATPAAARAEAEPRLRPKPLRATQDLRREPFVGTQRCDARVFQPDGVQAGDYPVIEQFHRPQRVAGMVEPAMNPHGVEKLRDRVDHERIAVAQHCGSPFDLTSARSPRDRHTIRPNAPASTMASRGGKPAVSCSLRFDPADRLLQGYCQPLDALPRGSPLSARMNYKTI